MTPARIPPTSEHGHRAAGHHPVGQSPAGQHPAAQHHLAPYAADFAEVALANVTRAYPNAPAHLLACPDELVEPRVLHPAFYGAYDWHSSAHMHWLLVRLLRACPEQVDRGAVTATLDAHLTPDALATEATYLRAHPSFERPYGWAWLLALTAECHVTRGAERWYEALAPAARTVAELLLAWLPKATYPVRHGTHTNSAFALGLVLDSAEAAGVPEVTAPVTDTLRSWFVGDHGASTRWEPSGQDFLSPLLSEADVMRRLLPTHEFAAWLSAFWPEARPGDGPLLAPPEVSDVADPQIGHLLGLCLSRAAALHSLAAALPEGDDRAGKLTADAERHLETALPTTDSGDFTTDHWLATFATLALDAAAQAR